MRRLIKTVEGSLLRVHIEYDYLTVGEIGNIQIRLQAALRSAAGLGRGEYAGRYLNSQPKFIASAINTGHSIDINLLLGVLAIALSAPGAVADWRRFSIAAYRSFMAGLVALGSSGAKNQDDLSSTEFDGMRIDVTRDEVDIKMSLSKMREMTPQQRRAFSNFIWSLVGPARRVDISDESSEISLRWGKNTKNRER